LLVHRAVVRTQQQFREISSRLRVSCFGGVPVHPHGLGAVWRDTLGKIVHAPKIELRFWFSSIRRTLSVCKGLFVVLSHTTTFHKQVAKATLSKGAVFWPIISSMAVSYDSLFHPAVALCHVAQTKVGIGGTDSVLDALLEQPNLVGHER